MTAAPHVLDAITRRVLRRAAAEFATPCYVYFVDRMRARIHRVREAFGGRLAISYAVKANPNAALLRRIVADVDGLDVSSIGEVRQALAAGCAASRLSCSGPAKRADDLRSAVQLEVGAIICESPREIDRLAAIADSAGALRPFLIRINPRRAPAKFSISMAGRASQFGIDEEELPDVLSRLGQWPLLRLDGFHIFSATNSLSAAAIDENFAIMADAFTRAAAHIGGPVRALVFGAGFGIPYTAKEAPLDLDAVADMVNPRLDALRRREAFADTACVLELGRYLTGPDGYLLTSVVDAKHSRGTDIRICDAGFNCHLAAFGLMGTVIRRNWPIWKVDASPGEPVHSYMLTGPLCAAIDVLASKIDLPDLAVGDVLAIGSSGAYGYTASPLRFIGHQPPREILAVGDGDDAALIDVSDDREDRVRNTAAGIAEGSA